MTPEALAEVLKVEYLGTTVFHDRSIWWFKDSTHTGTTLTMETDDPAPARTLSRKLRASRRAFRMKNLKAKADNRDGAAIKEVWREETMEGKE